LLLTHRGWQALAPAAAVPAASWRRALEDRAAVTAQSTGGRTLCLASATALELGIRRPVEEDSIRKIYQFMGNGDVDITTDWKGRYKEHLNLMRSGTLSDMATVLKSLYYLSLHKPLSFREKKMMEKAKELMVSEISEAVASPSSKVEEKLLGTLSRCFKTAKSRVAA
jgi:CarD family transcriptional regulator